MSDQQREWEEFDKLQVGDRIGIPSAVGQGHIHAVIIPAMGVKDEYTRYNKAVLLVRRSNGEPWLVIATEMMNNEIKDNDFVTIRG